MLYARKKIKTDRAPAPYPHKVVLSADLKKDMTYHMASLDASIQLRWVLTMLTGKKNIVPCRVEHSWRAIQEVLQVLSQEPR